jgi:phage terminase large subunit-like protein
MIGVLRRYWGDDYDYNRSRGHIMLSNGSQITGYSADRPDRLRGPQHHGAWADEVAAWRYADAWDQMKLGLRLGTRPRALATTTPRPIGLVRRMMDSPTTHVTRGSTFDNAANLAPSALADLEEMYGGTRLGRQELLGELIDDIDGALWTHAVFDQHRVTEIPERIVRTLVGVDPAVTSTAAADETGIVVASLGESGTVYVEGDYSLRAEPARWAEEVQRAVRRHDASAVVAEVNQGGDLVRTVLTAAGVQVPVRAAYASKSKAARAEPVAVMYARGNVRHVGRLGALEDQCAGWVPGVSRSPDRLDALVWVVSALTRAGGRPVRQIAS